MKVFWVVSFVPHIIDHSNSKEISGGWIEGMREQISNDESVNLSFVYKTDTHSLVRHFFSDRCTLINIPSNDYCSILEEVIKSEKPDIIHIWGTEFEITSQTIDVALKMKLINRVVVSIQGIVSEICKCMTIGLPSEVVNKKTFYEFVRKCSIKDRVISFEKRGEKEIRSIIMSKYIFGRTDWDMNIVKKYNQSNLYISLNENLRNEFYRHKWDYSKCDKNRIFAIRGDSPIKGLHILLKALVIVLKSTPNVKLYLAGTKPYNNGLISLIKQTSYGKYIKHFIKENKLSRHIVFLGCQDEKQIVNSFLKANVFVLPSTIENSPNSLGEAMILGLPCVASNVGGVSSMLTNNKEGLLYENNSHEELANCLIKILNNTQEAIRLSKNAYDRAHITHNRAKNYKRLMDSYEKIIESKVNC